MTQVQINKSPTLPRLGSALRTNGRPEASGVTSQQEQVFLSSWTLEYPQRYHREPESRRNNTVETITEDNSETQSPETSFEPRVQLDLNMVFLPWTSQFCELGCLPLAIEMLRPPQLVCPPCQHR